MGEPGWRSFVALGDSFTEGLDDRRSDGAGFRGWADLVAARLAARHREAAAGQPASEERHDFRYANLAVRGKLFDAIVNEQVPVALRMRADLVSFAGGGNDVLRPSFDGHALINQFDDVVRMLRANGSDVLVFRFADLTSRLPGRRLILPRMNQLTTAVTQVAEKYGARVIDLWHDQEFANPRLWSEDRLHLSSAGHRRVAGIVLDALGVPTDPEWLAPTPWPSRRSWVSARASDARWAGQHLAPWVKRRITGRSSGDAVTAKRPTLTPFPVDHELKFLFDGVSSPPTS